MTLIWNAQALFLNTNLILTTYLIFTTIPCGETTVTLMLELRKLRHGEVKLLVQSHTTGEGFQVEFVPQQPGSRVDVLNYYIVLLLEEDKMLLKHKDIRNMNSKFNNQHI